MPKRKEIVPNKPCLLLIKKNEEELLKYNGYDLRIIKLIEYDQNNELRIRNYRDNIKIINERNTCIAIDSAGLSFWRYLAICLNKNIFIRRIFLQDSFLRYNLTKALFLIKNRYFQYISLRFIFHFLNSLLDHLLFYFTAEKIGFVSPLDFNYLNFLSSSKLVCVHIGNSQGNDTIIIRKSLKNIARPIRFCFWGNLEYEPNYISFIHFTRKHWPILSNRFQSCTFSIYGKGYNSSSRYLDRYPNHKSANNVYFVGEFSSINKIVENEDIFLNIVEYGAGMQNKTIEAICAGIPMVSTSFGIASIKELKDYRYLYSDCVSLINAIERIIQDDTFSYRQQLSDEVKQHYSWKRTFLDYINNFMS